MAHKNVFMEPDFEIIDLTEPVDNRGEDDRYLMPTPHGQYTS